MEPFEQDELSDRELDDLLRTWESPAAPARLRAAVFPETARPWWQRLWHTSIRIPVPVGLAFAAMAMVAIWRWPAAAPRVVTKTERVEVPVIQERIVDRSVYQSLGDAVKAADAANRDRILEQQTDVHKLRPVAELRPVIIRRENVQN
jgi:hypothetical protein